MSSRAIRVLLVDADVAASRAARDYLAQSEVEVHVLPDPAVVLSDLDKIRADILLVDVSIPDVDGLSLCRRLRQRSSTPIIMLSGQDEVQLRVRALDDGADDVVLKPFALPELLARIRARVRRSRGDLVSTPQHIEVGSLIVDLAKRTVTLGERPIKVTGMELAVLTVLAARAGKPVSREAILRAVHGSEDASFDRSIDVIVSRLRSKLELDPRHPELIKTVRRGGYMLAIRHE
ncbi:MAG: response regulator transcription factor [Deltaproteobacteria bacterium]|nr:response regulator transcription factor [Deltaproteobacteria bacterium]